MEKKGTYHESQKRACRTYYEKNKEELLKKQIAREKQRMIDDNEYYLSKLAKNREYYKKRRDREKQNKLEKQNNII